MAALDRYKMHEGPCPCGNGTVRVNSCSDNHPWSRSAADWPEVVFNCAACEEKYEMEHVDGYVFVREKANPSNRISICKYS